MDVLFVTCMHMEAGGKGGRGGGRPVVCDVQRRTRMIPIALHDAGIIIN